MNAVILINGVQGKEVTSLARELLAQFGGMRGLLFADQSELQKVKGLGQAKVTALIAIAEMVFETNSSIHLDISHLPSGFELLLEKPTALPPLAFLHEV